MENHLDKIYLEYQVHVINNLTNSSLAINIFLSKFNEDKIGLITDVALYNSILLKNPTMVVLQRFMYQPMLQVKHCFIMM